jgi:hypothetical protein
VFISEIVPHLGRYCEVITRNGRLFGELVRLSTVLVLVRAKLPAAVSPHVVEAAEITEIIDLPDPHL